MSHHLFTKHLVLLCLCVGIALALPANAAEIDELRDQIKEKAEQIGELEKDITTYQNQLTEIGEEKRTLEGEIQTLDISRKKVETDIAVTERKIDAAGLTIEELNLEIQAKEENMRLNTDTIGETIRRINEAESQSLAETILAHDSLSDAWGDVDTLQQFQSLLTSDLRELTDLKQELEAAREDLLIQHAELSNFKSDLSGQRQVIVANKEEKDQLLTATKNEESNYQALLAEKLRQREQFARELQAIEEQIRIAIDPDSIPNAGSGILQWPLDSVRITQYFGNTPFASANPQVYKGAGHNGVDFGASRGSRVKAALSGTVMNTGNTDEVSGCYSYGKWALIRHNNGLATLYAHLDVISVTPGQQVATGETVGFSGNTGYSTGPHLHFTVYAAEGVRVERFTNSINCKNAVIPIAPREAYLNPLSYLPGA
ncbi:peptidoglycan DD-metalloendopeptidase family protein [Candidatus Wolfebacteria bacterium]|nr:peptidoglycan DD-metalloendopeptidase family protein [Candidatus Wolfebacteria bacterium]